MWELFHGKIGFLDLKIVIFFNEFQSRGITRTIFFIFILRMGEKRNYKKLEFSLEEEGQIIDFVKQNPSIYNPKDSEYKDRAKRDKLWNDLGEKLSKPG